MFCQNCGNQLPNSANFCAICGHNVSLKETSSGFEEPYQAPSSAIAEKRETPLFRTYAVLISILATIVAILIYGVIQNSANSALFINGVMANIFDPFVWLITLPFSIKCRRDIYLLPLLLFFGLVLCALKLYMQQTTGAHWITGSIAGNVIGFTFVGYVINSVMVFRRSRRQSNTRSGA